MASVSVEFTGLVNFENFMRLAADTTTRAASLAINQVAQRGGLTLARQHILDQVNFPSGYLTGDRLYVSRFASENSLEAVILARKRATSMARFTQGAALGRAPAGIRVHVSKGGGDVLKRAWLVRLRRGASLTEDNYNIGLAMRVNPGEGVLGKKTPHQSWLVPNAVALLYGPSVDQVFSTVADDIAPAVAQQTADEFLRQFNRLVG